MDGVAGSIPAPPTSKIKDLVGRNSGLKSKVQHRYERAKWQRPSDNTAGGQEVRANVACLLWLFSC